jgi:FixJ family two-component response regulator
MFRGMVPMAEVKVVSIVDDDELMRNALQGLLKAAGLPARVYA